MFFCRPCFNKFSNSSLSRYPIPQYKTLIELNWLQNLERNCDENRKYYEWCRNFPSILQKEFTEGSEDDFIKEINNTFRFFMNKNYSTATLCKGKEEINKNNKCNPKENIEEINDLKDERKIIDIEIPTCFEVHSDFSSDFKEEEKPTVSDKSDFFMIDDEKNSKIGKQQSSPINLSEMSDEGLGSFPQKFAYYDNNTFFAEHLLEERKLDNKTNFVKEEIKTEENLFVFKKVLKIIEKHMNTSACPLNFIRHLYISYLRSAYPPSNTSIMNDSSSKGKSKDREEQKVLKDIDCFVGILKTLLFDFYHISSNMYIISSVQLKNMFSAEALRYFVINSLFNNEGFYELVFEAEKKKNQKEEKLLQDGINKFPDLKLTDFGVSKEFLLDENPLSYEKLPLDYSTLNYSLAIDCVKNLQYIKSPVHKLKSVVLCGLMIKKSIEDFYFKIHKRVTNNMIHPTEFVRVYCFTVYKSKIPWMITHLNMIQEFLHKGALEKLKVPFFKYFKLAVEMLKGLKDVSNKHPKKFSIFLHDFLDEYDLA